MNIKKILFFIVMLYTTGNAFAMEEKDNRSFYMLPQKNNDLLFTLQIPHPDVCMSYYPKPNEYGVSGFYYKEQIICRVAEQKAIVLTSTSVDSPVYPSLVCRSAENLYRDYQRLSFLQKRRIDSFSNRKPI